MTTPCPLELETRSRRPRPSIAPLSLSLQAFKAFDRDASGDIDPDEFKQAMLSFGLTFTDRQVPTTTHTLERHSLDHRPHSGSSDGQRQGGSGSLDVMDHGPSLTRRHGSRAITHSTPWIRAITHSTSWVRAITHSTSWITGRHAVAGCEVIALFMCR